MSSMRGWWWQVCSFALALAVVGCGDDDTETPGTTQDSGVMMDAASGNDSGSITDAGGNDSGSVTDAGGQPDGGGEPDAGGEPDGGGDPDGGGSACSQAPDDACSQCTCMECPDAVETCYADPACATFVDCVSNSGCGSDQICVISMCQFPPPSAGDLISCVTGMGACTSACSGT